MAGDQKKFVIYAREQAKERIALGAGSRKDLYYYLLGAKDPQTGEGYSMSELWSESNLIIAAGGSPKLLFYTYAFKGAYTESYFIHRLPHPCDGTGGSLLFPRKLPKGTCRTYLRDRKSVV